MPKNSTTQNQLLALLYNELPTTAKTDVLQKVGKDQMLKQELNELAETIDLLNEISEMPSKTSIDIIMEYSAKTQEAMHA